MTILEAMRDPALFGPWFKDRDSWRAWEAFLAALFGLPMDADAWELIERRWQARARRNRKTKQTEVPPLVFHRNGRPIGDFRKTWAKALEKAGLPTDKAHRKLFHDFRRSAARDMVRAGVPQSVAMTITGHKTVSMFLRYNITDGKDQREALQRMAEMRRQRTEAAAENAAKVIPLRSGARS